MWSLITLRGFIVILLLLPNWPMDGVSTAIADILERRAIYCGEKTAACGCSVWKALRRIWIEFVIVSKIAWKVYIKKWPYPERNIRLHSLQNCTALQHCCDIVSKWKHSGHRYSMNKILYSLFSLSAQMLFPGLYLWQLILVRSLYSLRGFEVLQSLSQARFLLCPREGGKFVHTFKPKVERYYNGSAGLIVGICS